MQAGTARNPSGANGTGLSARMKTKRRLSRCSHLADKYEKNKADLGQVVAVMAAAVASLSLVAERQRQGVHFVRKTSSIRSRPLSFASSIGSAIARREEIALPGWQGVQVRRESDTDPWKSTEWRIWQRQRLNDNPRLTPPWQ